MAFNAEQINIILSAQTKDLRNELSKAERRIKGFEANAKKSMTASSKSFDMMATAAKRLAPILAAAFSINAFQGAINGAVEIGNLSDLAGVSAERFQVLALTTQQFGVSQEKLADILKDVNDKFGDYVQTGAGPLADFFEQIAPKIGVTASQFANLSSEEKLGAYINGLREANVSQAEMTFYMEAIASDSTLLVKAFENNSAAIKEMEQRAKELGITLDDDMIEKSREAKAQLDLMAQVVSNELSQALINLAPLVVSAAQGIASIAAAVNEFLQYGERIAAAANRPLLNEADLRAMAQQYEGMEPLLGKLNQAQSAYNANVEQYGEDSRQAAQWAERRTQAEQELRAAIAERQAKSDAAAGTVSSINATAAETRELEEQARLNQLSAEQRERARIAAERARREEEIRTGIMASGQEVTAQMAEQIEIIGQKYEEAAVAASLILTPVETAGGAARSTADAAKSAKEELEEMLKEMIAASPALQQFGFDAQSLSSVMGYVKSSSEDAFMSLVDGTTSAKDAFRAMAADIIRELYRVLVVQKMVGSFSPNGGGILGSVFTAFGGKAKASGGTVEAGQTYMTGESGRELFVPKTDGRILSPSQTMNISKGGGDSVTVVQNNTFGNGVNRAEINAMLPKLVEASKAAVLDAKRRGGSYGGAF
jgi:hypothetical protein